MELFEEMICALFEYHGTVHESEEEYIFRVDNNTHDEDACRVCCQGIFEQITEEYGITDVTVEEIIEEQIEVRSERADEWEDVCNSDPDEWD